MVYACPFLMGFVRCALWQLGLAGGAELLYPDLLGIRELFYFKRRSKLKGRAVAVDLAQQPLLCLLLRRKRRSPAGGQRQQQRTGEQKGRSVLPVFS